VFTAECECGDGLQTEEHILGVWTVEGAAGNNEGYSAWEQQKEYPKSVTSSYS
jgi:hypothetical protein